MPTKLSDINLNAVSNRDTFGDLADPDDIDVERYNNRHNLVGRRRKKRPSVRKSISEGMKKYHELARSCMAATSEQQMQDHRFILNKTPEESVSMAKDIAKITRDTYVKGDETCNAGLVRKLKILANIERRRLTQVTKEQRELFRRIDELDLDFPIAEDIGIEEYKS